MGEYVEFVDDIRHVYLCELVVGPAVQDMFSFFSACPELRRTDYTWKKFKLCYVGFGHVARKLPHVSLGSGMVGATGVDLSCVIEPIMGQFLSFGSEENFVTDTESISSSLELLETFSDRGLQSEKFAWESIDGHGSAIILSELEKSYKVVRVASDVESFPS